MALTIRDPNTIHLGGSITHLNEWKAGVAITPGHLIEFYTDTTVKLRPHASATEAPTTIFALEKSLHGKGPDDAYAINELVYAAVFHKGATVWALVGSGQDIDSGELLQSAGDGTLKSATATTADAGLAKFQSLQDTGGAVTEVTRIRVQIL